MVIINELKTKIFEKLMNFIFDNFSKHSKFIVGIIVISIMFVPYVFKKSVFYGIITIFVFVLIVILYWLYQKYKTLSIKYNNLKNQPQAQAQMNPEKISISIEVDGDAYFSSKTECAQENNQKYAQGSNQNLNNTKEENKNGNN